LTGGGRNKLHRTLALVRVEKLIVKATGGLDIKRIKNTILGVRAVLKFLPSGNRGDGWGSWRMPNQGRSTKKVVNPGSEERGETKLGKRVSLQLKMSPGSGTGLFFGGEKKGGRGNKGRGTQKGQGERPFEGLGACFTSGRVRCQFQKERTINQAGANWQTKDSQWGRGHIGECNRPSERSCEEKEEAGAEK